MKKKKPESNILELAMVTLIIVALSYMLFDITVNGLKNEIAHSEKEEWVVIGGKGFKRER